MHERAAVEVGHELHVFRQPMVVEFTHRVVHAAEHARRVLALQQQHDAFDRVGVVVLAQDAAPLLLAEPHLAQVLDEHRHAVLLHHDDVAQVVEPADQAHAAHHEALLAALDDAAASTRVVGIDGARDLRQRQVVLAQFGGVELEHELGRDAAEVAHVGNPGDLLQARDHLPELQLGQLAQASGFRLQGVAVDLADRRGQRVQPRLRAIRQRDRADAFLQPLARPVIVHAVLEHDRDQRQAEGALRAHHLHARRAHDLALERDRDLLFDLLGRQAIDLREHLRGGVGDVRVGFERQQGPAVGAIRRDQCEHQPDDAAPLQAHADQAVNH